MCITQGPLDVERRPWRQHRDKSRQTRKLQIMREKTERAKKEGMEKLRDTPGPRASKDLTQDSRGIIVCPDHPSKRDALFGCWRLEVCHE